MTFQISIRVQCSSSYSYLILYFSDLKPGVMSKSLRAALGLEDYQVSEMVYRMRLIGYPPGWLIEAREHTGEIALFGGNGEGM